MKRLCFYVHTHWDREWYHPFQTFRAQLVPVVRGILGGLESGDLPRFYMDGQSIIFEDVTEIDPSLGPRISRAMAEGKLLAGPWYVLNDQMLVGGESLVRNLKIGLDDTRKFGPPAMVGYCPDTFGHSQDLPRVLSGFGINNAVVWRGAPFLKQGPVFRWSSPDGSNVLGFHFTNGYYQTGFHEALAATKNGAGAELLESVAAQLKPWVAKSSDEVQASHPFIPALNAALMPVGADHVGPPSGINEFVGKMNDVLRDGEDTVELVPTTLPEFLEDVEQASTGGNKLLAAVDGELRSNITAPYYARSYLLYGVLSTRLYLKRANRISEHRLVKLCEPVLALLSLLGVKQYPIGELNYLWKLLLKNHPHDSICGCSVDAVHRDMMNRTEQIEEGLSNLLASATASLSGATELSALSPFDHDFGNDSLITFNLSTKPASGPVSMIWTESPGQDSIERPDVQIAQRTFVDHLFSGFGAVPYYKELYLCTGWVWADNVPPLGSSLQPWYRKVVEAAPCPARPESGSAVEHPPVILKGTSLSNGHLEVKVTPAGRIAVNAMDHRGKSVSYQLKHQFRDVADVGDTYNFDPIPSDAPIVSRVISVEAGELAGPLLGSVLITYEIDIPQEAVPDKTAAKRSRGKIEPLKRSTKKIKHTITSTLTLKRGIPILFFDTAWHNQSRDHRLEVVLNTGEPVIRTFSENHYSIVTREHAKAKTKLPVALAHEAPPDKYPAQRFFVANDQLFLNTGMPEYGVDGDSVTLTMLRAVSWLSKSQLYTRGGGAGPHLHVPEANCLGPNRCSYGWAPLMVRQPAKANRLSDAACEAAYALAEQYEGTMWASLCKLSVLPDQLRQRFSLVQISNPAISVAAMLQQDGELLIRLLNTTMEPQRAQLKLHPALARVERCKLSGEIEQRLSVADHQLDIEFGVNELITLRLSQA